jgi:hypothetical protein
MQNRQQCNNECRTGGSAMTKAAIVQLQMQIQRRNKEGSSGAATKAAAAQLQRQNRQRNNVGSDGTMMKGVAA